MSPTPAEIQRRYRQRHPDRVRAAKRAYEQRKKEQEPTYNARRLKALRDRHSERYKNYARRNRNRIREQVITAYGGICACCGETRLEFLTIDHIHGGGTQHRKQSGLLGQKFYWWLKRQGYPKGYRVLCANCNMAEARYSGCPHKTRPGSVYDDDAEEEDAREAS